MVQEYLDDENEILKNIDNEDEPVTLNCSGITTLVTKMAQPDENNVFVGFPGSGNTLIW